MYFFRQSKDRNSGKEHENYTNDPIFSSNFSALPACNIHFPEVDTLRLLKTYIMFCLPAGAKYLFF